MCTLESIDTLLVTVYRPPSATDEKFVGLLDNVQQYLDAAFKTKHYDVYMTGDFNLPVIDWESHTIDHSQGLKRGVIPAQRLFEFMGFNFLSQVVTKPTRENRTLDLVLTNCPNYVSNVDCNYTPLSDHDIVKVTLRIDLKPSTMGDESHVPTDPFSFQSLQIATAETLRR